MKVQRHPFRCIPLCSYHPAPGHKRGVLTPAVPDGRTREGELGTRNAECGIGNAEFGSAVRFTIHHSAFSLAETLVSMLLIAGLVVVGLNTVGASTVGQQRTADRAIGHLLAQDLMAEILVQKYEEPDETPVFGPEGTESPTGRSTYDDVDDYRSWTATPIQHKDGTVVQGMTDWSRCAIVEWVEPNDLTTTSVTPTGVKRITVTVDHGDIVMGELVGIRTQELPPPQPGPAILLVVCDVAAPTAQESARVALMESWSCQVSSIAASDTVEAFTAAIADADVAYISEEIDPAALGTKLRDAAIGVVNEEIELTQEFGFGEVVDYGTRDVVQVADNTHYITSPFSIGSLILFSSSQPVHWRDSVGTSDALTLAETDATGGGVYKPSLATLETGDLLCDGGTAAGRRVQLPWGAGEFDINTLNADAETIMQRAIVWAANKEAPTP